MTKLMVAFLNSAITPKRDVEQNWMFGRGYDFCHSELTQVFGSDHATWKQKFPQSMENFFTI
jgi:hypothetical protein